MSKIENRELVIISLSPYEIILQDVGGGTPGGDLFKITPEAHDTIATLLIEELVPKELK